MWVNLFLSFQQNLFLFLTLQKSFAYKGYFNIFFMSILINMAKGMAIYCR